MGRGGAGPLGGALADVSLAVGLLSDGGGRELEAEMGSGLDSDWSAPRDGVTTKRTAAIFGSKLGDFGSLPFPH